MSEKIVGKYKHFKGNIYYVYGVALDECENKYILYRQCYGDEAFWIRPYDMFFDSVSNDDKKLEKRFTKTNSKHKDEAEGISELIEIIKKDEIIIKHSETEQKYCIISVIESIVYIHTILSDFASGYLTDRELLHRMGYYVCAINGKLEFFEKSFPDEKLKLKIGNNDISVLERHINPCSIDLQIADDDFLYTKRKLIDPQSIEHIASANNLWKGVKVHHSKGRKEVYFKLKPGCTVLTKTKDKISIPNDCAGKVEIKSTYARLSLSVTFGDFCNPGYNGYFPLEITNHGKHTVIIHRNETMAQLMLIPLHSPILVDYSHKSSYNNEQGYDDGTPYSFWRERSLRSLRKNTGTQQLIDCYYEILNTINVNNVQDVNLYKRLTIKSQHLKRKK